MAYVAPRNPWDDPDYMQRWSTVQGDFGAGIDREDDERACIEAEEEMQRVRSSHLMMLKSVADEPRLISSHCIALQHRNL